MPACLHFCFLYIISADIMGPSPVCTTFLSLPLSFSIAFQLLTCYLTTSCQHNVPHGTSTCFCLCCCIKPSALSQYFYMIVLMDIRYASFPKYNSTIPTVYGWRKSVKRIQLFYYISDILSLIVLIYLVYTCFHRSIF